MTTLLTTPSVDADPDSRQIVADARELDERLGDPEGRDAAFGHRACARLDRAEAFPTAMVAELDALGVADHYVPAELGGALDDFTTLLDLVRVVAARDLTVAIAHGKTFLGSACVWVAGSPQQRSSLAARIMAGDIVALALTERGRGADLLATQTRAVRQADGWRLDGEKWLINNATRARHLCLLVRSGESGDPRGHSLVLVDKHRLDSSAYECLPKVPTYGIRGADISGIVLRDAVVPDEAIVGAPGQGIEIVLKSLQLTRTVCCALSLGAADHALDLVTRFVTTRHLYGGYLSKLPHVRRRLGELYGDHLMVDIVARFAARSIHALPRELAVISSLAKAFVPIVVDELVAGCAELLGARAFLTDEHAEGAFQKLERDHRIVSIFDGSTVVNENVLVNHFGILSRRYAERRADPCGYAQAAHLTHPLPAAALDELSLVAFDGCSVVQGLSSAVTELGRRPVPERVHELATQLLACTDDVHAQIEQTRPTSHDVPAESFDLVRRYELCFAGAVAIRVWLENSDTPLSGLWQDALWLEAVLDRVLGRLDPIRYAARVQDTSADRLAAIVSDRLSLLDLVATRRAEVSR